MNKKYFLIGLGLGISLTSLLFLILLYNINIEKIVKIESTEDEIIERARKLGMVFISDIRISEENIEIIIEDGFTSSQISSLLVNKGIIKDSLEFNEYIKKNDLENKFIYGEFSISKNSSFEEIADILTEQ